MNISDMFLPEFDQEMTTARKTLERIPEDKLGWKPHEKSMTLGRLAGHVAELAGWAVPSLTQDSLDFAPPGKPPYPPTIATSRKQVLDLFDKNREESRRVIAGTSNEEFMKNWTLLRGGKPLFSMPKVGVLRSFCMNHIIHHRAQLGVYLRLNNIAVPSVYGPSADEGTL
jgi:uncharacterized damage-inducible protein DinB